MKKPIAILTEIIKQNNIDLSFNIIEIGAVQLTDAQEPFYELLNYFPSSQIIGFELEKAVCANMNANAKKGVKYYPYALGKANEKRKLYITQNPMCSSLYKPNEELIKLYNRFEVAYLKEETAAYLRNIGVQHLLIDQPSIDKEFDQGKLLAHKAFWNYPNEIDQKRTITELIGIPDKVKDGKYLLNISLANIENDASPSRPIIYEIF